NRRFAVESARRNPSPPGAENGSSPPPQPRSPGTDRNAQRPSDQDRSALGQGSVERRGPGGSGGGGIATPEAGSPQGRLDAAIERIRASRQHRLSGPPATADTPDHRKDW